MQKEEPPSRFETLAATNKLRNGKAGGRSSILPEMLRAGCCKSEFHVHLCDLTMQMWSVMEALRDWSSSTCMWQLGCRVAIILLGRDCTGDAVPGKKRNERVKVSSDS